MSDKIYLLMDGRASYDTNVASIMEAGNANDLAKAANTGIYGGDCIIVNPTNMEPMWEWFTTGTWIPEKSIINILTEEN